MLPSCMGAFRVSGCRLWRTLGASILRGLVTCEEDLLGGAAGIRTPDLRRARAALSQLSYGPAHPHSGWARLDSNQGPRPYQGRALTT